MRRVVSGMLVLTALGGCRFDFWKSNLEEAPPLILAPISAPTATGTDAARRLDLGTGALIEVALTGGTPAIPDTAVLLRRIEPGSGMYGVPPAESGRRPDAVWLPYATDRFWLGIAELTRGQWSTLALAAGCTAGAEIQPWLAVDPVAAAGGAGGSPTLPATNLSLALVEATLAAWNARHPGVRLRLPTPIEWEHACRAGSLLPYAFPGGGTTDAGPFAVVRETRTGDGPQPVIGNRRPNALGLWDLHGNVWELVRSTGPDAELRGGSWQDNLLSARSGNRQRIDRGQAHALAGVRLVAE